MDPFTAFSLACGVIQVVDFINKILIKCKEMYEEDSLSEYQELKTLTKNLVVVHEYLDLPSAKQREGSFNKPYEQNLSELARQCSTTADQLVEKLHSLKITGTHKKWQAILKTVKIIWEKGEIQETQKRLDSYRAALDTQDSDQPGVRMTRELSSSAFDWKLVRTNPGGNRQDLDLASLQHGKEF